MCYDFVFLVTLVEESFMGFVTDYRFFSCYLIELNYSITWKSFIQFLGYISNFGVKISFLCFLDTEYIILTYGLKGIKRDIELKRI